MVLEGHGDGIRQCKYSVDGSRIASRSGDGTARIWDAETGACLSMLGPHAGEVHSCAFSPDAHHLATGCEDNQLRVWDTSEVTCLHTLAGHLGDLMSEAWSDDGEAQDGISCDYSPDEASRLAGRARLLPIRLTRHTSD